MILAISLCEPIYLFSTLIASDRADFFDLAITDPLQLN